MNYERINSLREQAAQLYTTGNEHDADYAAECEQEADEIEAELARGPIDA